MTDQSKAFYATYHDRIVDKRFQSEFAIRRLTHRDIYDSVLRHVPAGARVLDAGCGEGVLSVLMREKGAIVTGVDYSGPNVAAAQRRAAEAGLLGDGLTLMQGDAENLAFEDGSFDYVVSNHVLEHLPDFERGIRELYRVTRDCAVIGVPTCLNPSAWALLGGDNYWRLSKRSVYAVPLGLSRVIAAWLSGQDGVNEGYAGDKANVHIFRFPGVVTATLRHAGFREITQQAQSIRLPYVPVSLTRWGAGPLLRHVGIGTVYVCRK